MRKKRGPGRPKGSKNRAKPTTSVALDTSVWQAFLALQADLFRRDYKREPGKAERALLQQVAAQQVTIARLAQSKVTAP